MKETFNIVFSFPFDNLVKAVTMMERLDQECVLYMVTIGNKCLHICVQK